MIDLQSLDSMPEILTAANISKHLGISARRVYELFKIKPEFGGIPNFDIGYSKRVEKADLIKWIQDQKKKKAV